MSELIVIFVRDVVPNYSYTFDGCTSAVLETGDFWSLDGINSFAAKRHNIGRSMFHHHHHKIL